MRTRARRSAAPFALALAIANCRHGPDVQRPFAAGSRTVTRSGADRLRSPSETSQFLFGLGIAVPPGAPNLAQLLGLRDVREAVRALAEGDESAYLRRARRVGAELRFRYVGTRLRPLAEGWGALVGVAFLESIDLLAERGRLRICHNAECGWVFMADSAGRAQVWCEAQRCGERVRARRYRRRRSLAVSA